MNSVGEQRRLDLGIGPIGQAEKQLGELVQFERRDKDRSEGKSARVQSAEILIFTGVRYERDTSTMPTKPTASGAKRKRG